MYLRRRLLLGAAVLVALTACGEVQPGAQDRRPLGFPPLTPSVTASLSASATPRPPDQAPPRGKVVTSLGVVDLANGVVQPLLSPTGTAVPSPDGRFVLYTSGNDAISVRLRDTETATDVLLADGATSPAWRGAGPIAFLAFRPPAAPATTDEQTPAEALVVAAPGSPPTSWTGVGLYDVLAWAGDRLLVSETLRGSSGSRLLSFSGPGTSTPLGEGWVSLLAISPDGRLALVTRSPGGPDESLALLDVATGAVGGRVDATGLGFVTAASWDGDRVALSTPQGIAVLRWSAPTLTLATVIPVPYTGGIPDPSFTAGHSHVVGLNGEMTSAGYPPEDLIQLVDCDLATGTVSLRTLAKRSATDADGAWQRLRNPSRPLVDAPEEIS